MHVPAKFTALILSIAALYAEAAAQGGRAAESYPTHPDSQRQEGVPVGKVTKGTFTDSKIYPFLRAATESSTTSESPA